MTQATPPGWYPDPGQKQDGPATERWWDGKAWTDQVRSAGPAAAAGPPPEQPPAQPAAPATAAGPYSVPPGYPVHPGYPGFPVQPPSARRRRLRTGIAVAAAVAVLAGIGVGVYVLTDDGSGGGSASSQQDRRGPGGQNDPFGGEGGGGGDGESPAPDSPGGSEPPTIDRGSVTDPVNDISLPIPDGWSGQQLSVGAQVTSDDSYECPGDPAETCTKGGAYSAPQEVLGTKGGTAEEVAKADIEVNAKESYGDAYGGITSHEELASKAVTVAGQKGYLVRWKAVTKEGSDGYVESLAFPAPGHPERIVLVRFGVDVEEGLSVIDEITEGIEVDSSGGGGGSGQDV
jgi:hypothetical protein